MNIASTWGNPLLDYSNMSLVVFATDGSRAIIVISHSRESQANVQAGLNQNSHRREGMPNPVTTSEAAKLDPTTIESLIRLHKLHMNRLAIPILVVNSSFRMLRLFGIPYIPCEMIHMTRFGREEDIATTL